MTAANAQTQPMPRIPSALPPSSHFDEKTDKQDAGRPECARTQARGLGAHFDKTKQPGACGMEKLLFEEEVEALLGLRRGQARRLARAGVLPHIEIPRSNREIRFQPSAIEAWIAANTKGGESGKGA
jgi:predicted DNA-binding transcriptional regulator AlpA